MIKQNQEKKDRRALNNKTMSNNPQGRHQIQSEGDSKKVNFKKKKQIYNMAFAGEKGKKRETVRWPIGLMYKQVGATKTCL